MAVLRGYHSVSRVQYSRGSLLFAEDISSAFPVVTKDKCGIEVAHEVVSKVIELPMPTDHNNPPLPGGWLCVIIGHVALFRYRTIMSYGDGCTPTPPITNHFSNPDIYYLGLPTGTATEDNARRLEETMVRLDNA